MVSLRPKLSCSLAHVAALTGALLTTASLCLILGLSFFVRERASRETLSVREWPEYIRPQPRPHPPPSAADPAENNAREAATGGIAPRQLDLKIDPVSAKLPRANTQALAVDIGPRQPHPSASGQAEVKARHWSLRRHTQPVFELEALDAQPVVLYRPKYRIPPALREAGMPDTTVQVHVMIHEDGRLTLIDYEHLPYPALKPTVERIIRRMRYSTPQKNGRAVKGEFILPLNLEGV